MQIQMQGKRGARFDAVLIPGMTVCRRDPWRMPCESMVVVSCLSVRPVDVTQQGGVVHPKCATRGGGGRYYKPNIHTQPFANASEYT